MQSFERISSVLGGAGGALGKRLFLARQAAFWLDELGALHALDDVRARVVEVIDETADVKTFVLEPSAGWSGHCAGEYTLVKVDIDGVREQRCYSISSAPGEGHISITVKLVPGGRVSTWLHRHARPGDILRIGQPAGEFVLPAPTPDKLLLVSGGSGITPVMSILRDLAVRDDIRDVTFVHYARSRADVIFGEELEDLAERHPGLRLIVRLDDDPTTPLGFDEADFAGLVPDFAARWTYLCGPAPVMDRAERMWDRAGASARLVIERFSSPLTLAPVPAAGAVQVRLSRSSREVVARGAGSLLEQLERAGERPPNGCRMGICHTCKCRKRSGTVQNLLTGELSSEPDQDIQLCISVPRSNLELDL